MNARNAQALIVQGGASNRRKVAAVLLEAIDEVRAEGGSTEEDPAVFLILHQLTFLLTGHDLAVGDERLSKRWDEATKAVQPTPTPDYYVEHHGSICILNPITPACIAWVEASVGNEETQHWGKHGVVIEPRYLDDILIGLQAQGFQP